MDNRDSERDNENASAMTDTEGGERTRTLTGTLGFAVRIGAIALSLYVLLYVSTLFDWLGLNLFGAHRALAYAGVIALLFLLFPARKTGPWDRVPWYDFLFAAAGAGASLYAFLSWEKWTHGVSLPTRFEELLGIALLVVTMEGARRVLGMAFMLVALVFIIYPLIGPYLPGILVTRHYSISSLVQFFYLSGGSSGMLGTPMEIFTTTVAVFLLFGAFLKATGAARVFLDAALGMAGRFRAGMAKVSVLASALFATISGIGVANVLVTGAFTIPAMKRMGYRPSLAGAIEAAASTGGILMPPVMGAAAFLMADILGVPYWDIVVAAFLPGVLYYIAMFTMVDFEGARAALKGVPTAEIPPLGRTFAHGWFLLAAIVVLLVLLGVWNLPVDQCALIAVVVLVALSQFRRNRLSLGGIVAALEDGGRLLAQIGVAGAVVGIIMGGFALTGLGALLPSAMHALAGDSLLLLLILAAFASVILGMGAPPLLVYVLLAATVAPAMIDFGVPPIAAHMFIFYFGLLSMLTPPVALSALIASRVAQSNFWTTALEASRLGIIAFVIPFFFVYQPVLLFQGDAVELARAIPTATAGVVALAGALTRYLLFRPLPAWEAIPLGVGGLLLLYPENYSDAIGLALMSPTVIATAVAAWRRHHS